MATERSHPTVTVRPATPADAVSVTRLMASRTAEAGESTSPSEAYILDYLACPSSAILLAKRQRQLVGLLSYSCRPDLYHGGQVCLVEEVVVAAGSRRQGIASALLQALESRLLVTGCCEVSLAVMPGNTAALKLYRAHGFTGEALLLERHFGG